MHGRCRNCDKAELQGDDEETISIDLDLTQSVREEVVTEGNPAYRSVLEVITAVDELEPAQTVSAEVATEENPAYLSVAEVVGDEMMPARPVGAEVSTEPSPEFLDVSEVVANDWSEFSQFHFDRNKLEFDGELGEGHFGKVWKAWAVGVSSDGERTEVAVKTVREGEDFKKEIRILAEFDHVNIIRLLGVCLLRAPLYMITELMNKV